MRAHAKPERVNARAAKRSAPSPRPPTRCWSCGTGWSTEQVSLVVMEATGDYWRGAFYLLEDDLNVILVNAAHAKGLPGRKTDVCDCRLVVSDG